MIEHLLTSETCEILRLSQHAAVRANNSSITPENLLQGLVSFGAGEGKNFNVLAFLHLSYHQFVGVFNEFKDDKEPFNVSLVSVGTPPSSRTFHVFQEATFYAQRQGRPYARAEDLLYALALPRINGIDSRTYHILGRLGVSTASIEELMRKKV
ncbi:MAG: hypothetical protein AABX72_00290 [Nanoarchaeota archaeon]